VKNSVSGLAAEKLAAVLRGEDSKSSKVGGGTGLKAE